MEPLVAYEKPYRDGAELAQKMIKEGLEISSEAEAQYIIEAISYFRLKAYFIPFKIGSDHKNPFIPGTSLSDVIDLYKFDMELRSVFFKYISRIEVFIRAAFDQEMTKDTGNPFWYLDSSLYSSSGDKKNKVVNTILDVRRYFLRSKEEFSIHYRDKYINPFSPLFNELPPGWVAIELMTYGHINTLMECLDADVKNRIFPMIYEKLGMNSMQIFNNWVDLLHGVRNVCAHHSRFFNRNFPAPTNIIKKLSPKVDLVKTEHNKDQLNRLYSVMAVIHCLCKSSVRECDIASEVAILISKFNIKENVLRSMGFPVKWMEEPLFFS